MTDRRLLDLTARGWIALAAALAFLWLAMKAPAQEHQHPAKDRELHNKFYSTWYMPDNPARSCCNKVDCYPTLFQVRNGQWYAQRREDGAWIRVPPSRFEQNRTSGVPRDSPDESSHVCMQPPGQTDAVFCAVLGTGG
jgi:hypothetical protein